MKFLNLTIFPKPVAFFATVCAAVTAFAPRAQAQGGTDLYNWTGFYIGGNVGAIRSEFDFSGPNHQDSLFTELDVADQFYNILQPQTPGVSETGLATFFGRPEGFNDGSAIGGGQVGYNHQFGHFVVGVEGDFDRTAAHRNYAFDGGALTTIIGANQIGTTIGGTDFSGVRRAEMNWEGSLRGRIGYAVGPFLLYATGGIAWTELDVFANDVARTSFVRFINDGVTSPDLLPFRSLGTVTSTNIGRDDEVISGWTGGGGIEWAISKTVSLGLEYRHTDFGDETFNFASNNFLSPSSTRVDLITDQVTFKLNVMLSHLFGHQEYASMKMSTSPWAGENEKVSVGYTASNSDDKSSKDKTVGVEEPFSWTGFYLGGHVGGAWNNFDFGGYDSDVDLSEQLSHLQSMFRPAGEATVAAVAPQAAIAGGSIFRFSTPGQDGGTDDTIIGGGQIGYNHQWGNWVFGAEGDFSGMPSNSASTRFGSTGISDFFVSNISSVTNFTSVRDAETLWSASARGRFGWTQGRLLLYVTGGVAFAGVECHSEDRASTEFFTVPTGTAIDQVPPNATSIGTVSSRTFNKERDVQLGWTGGGGAEWAITKIASLGLEYRHNDFGDDNYTSFAHRKAISSGATNVDVTGDQMTLRVNLLLGSLH